jgi:hypothetical protein
MTGNVLVLGWMPYEESITHPKIALCETPFMSHINRYVLPHREGILREFL